MDSIHPEDVVTLREVGRHVRAWPAALTVRPTA